MAVLLHVGYHKTGTTWLQERFFATDPLFRVVADHAAIDAQIVRPNSLDFDAQRARSALNHGSNAERDGAGRVPVLSSEILSGNPLTGGRDAWTNAHRLQAMFPRARVLIGIRNQVAMLGSLYQQYVRRAGRLHWRQFFEQKTEIDYYAFDSRHLRYERLVDLYRGLFSKEQVKVVLFEDLVRDPVGFCQSVADFAVGGRATLGPIDPSRRGVSASVRALPVLRQINRFRTGPMNPAPCLPLDWLASRAYRAVEKADVLLHSRISRPKDRRMEAYLQERFADTYRPGNRHLAKLLDRDLGALKYPV